MRAESPDGGSDLYPAVGRERRLHCVSWLSLLRHLMRRGDEDHTR